jgi:hypothetical protein
MTLIIMMQRKQQLKMTLSIIIIRAYAQCYYTQGRLYLQSY